MILAKLILAIVALVFIFWLIGGLTRDRPSRRRRRRNSSR
jgi:hypothetical protein